MDCCACACRGDEVACVCAIRTGLHTAAVLQRPQATPPHTPEDPAGGAHAVLQNRPRCTFLECGVRLRGDVERRRHARVLGAHDRVSIRVWLLQFVRGASPLSMGPCVAFCLSRIGQCFRGTLGNPVLPEAISRSMS